MNRRSVAMVETDNELESLARALGEALRARRWFVACAESCTGGWLAKSLTDVPGSSAWFGWGFVSYANEAKTGMLGVPAALIGAQGAVSEAVACAMAEAARRISGAQLAVAVTGIAGPHGDTPEKPVGSVWIACASPTGTHAVHKRFTGTRESVRRQSVAQALRAARLELERVHA